MTGDSRRSWTWPWRCALFARLGDGERASIMLQGHLIYSTLTNLFANHPPFQLDGNFGISGAVAEMRCNRHEGMIRLLPAIPTAWKATGSFTGLRARGGYRVSCTWKDGVVTDYEIVADRTESRSPVSVHVNGQAISVTPIEKTLYLLKQEANTLAADIKACRDAGLGTTAEKKKLAQLAHIISQLQENIASSMPQGSPG